MNQMLNPQMVRLVRFILDNSEEAYLVGGAVRDYLLGRDSSPDFDIVTRPSAFELAAKAAAELNFTFIPFDPERETSRIVLKDPFSVIDISSFKGETIEADLVKRDFTINALAISLSDFAANDSPLVIDVTGGIQDLKNGVIRCCSADSFKDDPLRILRAFRFAAQLKFDLTENLTGTIQSEISGLNRISGERIRDELMTTLATPGCFHLFHLMSDLKIIDTIFPELIPMRGCDQNPFHHLDVWEHSFESVRILEDLLDNKLVEFEPASQTISDYIRIEYVQGRPIYALLKLAALFHDAGKPQSKFRLEGRIRFFGHESVSTEMLNQALMRLKFSGREIKFLKTIVSGHMRPTIFTGEMPSTKALRRLHRDFGEHIIGLLMLFLADLGASQGPARPKYTFRDAFHRVRDALTMLTESTATAPEPLLRGRDLIREFNIPPGPHIGQILKQIIQLQDNGEIATYDEAIERAGVLLMHMQPVSK